MKRAKITIIGAGNVGASAAQWIAAKNLADVVLIDVVENLAKGKALDLMQSLPLLGSGVKVSFATDYKDSADSEVVVITAGVPRKEGMSRDDLVKINEKIVRSVTEQAVKYSPECVIIVVSNPLDVIAYTAYKASGFPRERVIGMAGVLDSARFKAFIADEINVSVRDVNAIVLGCHGDAMIPMERLANVSGIPVTELIPHERIQLIINRTKNGGAEFLPLLNTSAWLAPGTSVAEMAESIVKDQKRIMPCSVYLDGEYGITGIFMGVPVKLGRKGAEEIIQIKLTIEERKQFDRAAEHVKGMIDIVR